MSARFGQPERAGSYAVIGGDAEDDARFAFEIAPPPQSFQPLVGEKVEDLLIDDVMRGGPDLRPRVGRGVDRDLPARQRREIGVDAFRPRRAVDAVRWKYLELRVVRLVRAARGDGRHFLVAGLAQQPLDVRTYHLGVGHIKRAR